MWLWHLKEIDPMVQPYSDEYGSIEQPNQANTDRYPKTWEKFWVRLCYLDISHFRRTVRFKQFQLKLDKQGYPETEIISRSLKVMVGILRSSY